MVPTSFINGTNTSDAVLTLIAQADGTSEKTKNKDADIQNPGPMPGASSLDKAVLPPPPQATKTTDINEKTLGAADASSAKKTLPEHVKNTFGQSSADFVAFAQKKEGAAALPEKTAESILNIWDRALLFGENPGGRVPLEIKDLEPKAKEGVTSTSVDDRNDIPQKTEAVISGMLPTQVVEDTKNIEKVLRSVERANQMGKQASAPKDISAEILSFPKYIPKKPISSVPKKEEKSIPNILPAPAPKAPSQPVKASFPASALAAPALSVTQRPPNPETIKNAATKPEENTPKATASPYPFVIPQKKQMPLSDEMMQMKRTAPAAPEKKNDKKDGDAGTYPEMSDLLKQKIIDGQLRVVFESSPEGTKELLEKLPALEILKLRESDASGKPEDPWKLKLRDYIVKLKWQGKVVFGGKEATDPKEDEKVSDYIKRIYPSLVKMEIEEDAKKKK